MSDEKHLLPLERRGALQLRQEFGQVLNQMAQGAAPIIIERNSTPVAVIVSYALFQERFVEHQTQDQREQILQRFRAAQKPSAQPSLSILQGLRYGEE